VFCLALHEIVFANVVGLRRQGVSENVVTVGRDRSHNAVRKVKAWSPEAGYLRK
jgi:hypothetical protein